MELGVTRKQILHYVFLPQILPRVRELFSSGFGFLAFLMAQIYSAAGILPRNHPYLSGRNIGRFGIRHVMTEAASRLKFDLKHIDQLAIFTLLLFAIVILLAQLFILLMSMFSIAAYALDPGTFNSFAHFFGEAPYAAGPEYDIAFIILDQVFGLQDFFESCVSVGSGPGCFFAENIGTQHGLIISDYPYPFHLALQNSFMIYSEGLLVVGVLIFVYFMFAVVAETAQSGTPFGQRFNHVWAPIRMVVAFGLLVPIAQGFNSGQWIVFYAAKFGSNFASNGWQVFLSHAVATDTLAGDGEDMVAIPKLPEVMHLIEFGAVLATCIEAHEFIHLDDKDSQDRNIEAYLYNPDVTTGTHLPLDGTDFDAAVEHFMREGVPRDIHIAFGTVAQSKHIESAVEGENEDAILPACGRLVLPITDYDETVSPGSYVMQEGYYELIQLIFQNAASATWDCTGNPDVDFLVLSDLRTIGRCMCIRYLEGFSEHIGAIPPADATPPAATHLAHLRGLYMDEVADFMDDALDAQRNADWYEDQSRYGWAGAALWYNKLAELNGSMITSVNSGPYVASYPQIMEEILSEKQQADGNISYEDRFKPVVSDNELAQPRDPSNESIARVLYLTQSLWNNNYSQQSNTGNLFLDAINIIFGTQGLFSIQDNIEQGVYPMAALTAIGKSLVESSIWLLGGSALGAVSSGIPMVGQILSVLGSAALTIAIMGLGIGFVLFYVLPFLPFIYFFFAVGGWVKGIFEAIVGVPLWALAHIRIDGNGLPGDAALQGYYLILEVFLRPIMIIFGLVAGIIIFSAQTQILLDVWNLVTSNVLGFDETCGGGACDPEGVSGALQYLRSGVDSFFFTVIFAIICYMVGMSSFKLVDAVPNHILRWMGANASTFGDMNDDQAQGIVQNATIGGQMVGSSLKTSLEGINKLGQSVPSYIQGIAGRGKGGG